MGFSINMRRTAPFIILMLVFHGAVAAADPRGLWLFVEDGTGVEVAPCAGTPGELCGVIVQLPRDAAALPVSSQSKLCGAVLMGSLKPGQAVRGEVVRLDGWVIDPEALFEQAHPQRYAASLVLLSDVRARLDVRGAFDVVLESHELVRAIAPAKKCG